MKELEFLQWIIDRFNCKIQIDTETHSDKKYRIDINLVQFNGNSLKECIDLIHNYFYGLNIGEETN